jgi:hypothetical protein
MNLAQPLPILTLRSLADQVCSKLHIPAVADAAVVVVKFLPIRKRGACGSDNTAQRHFGLGARRRTEAWKTAQVEISLDGEVSWR